MNHSPEYRRLSGAMSAVPLVDHHVHGAWTASRSRAEFENALNEGNTAPLAPWESGFDTQLGFAVRAHIAPLLGLPAHVPADAYWRSRAALGDLGLAAGLLPAAGVESWLVDEGFSAGVCTRTQLAELAGSAAGGNPATASAAYEIVRLETLAEEVLVQAGPDGYLSAFGELLRERLRGDDAVGVKSIAAYRTGFAIDWGEHDRRALTERVHAWADRGGTRLTDPALVAFGVRTALEPGLRSEVGKPVPLQFHVGFGDRDARIDLSNPMHLSPLLAEFPGSPVALLHCYPYEREAGYLAQAYSGVHMDVGLAVNFLGARAASLVGRSLELAPFSKILYSSDACGPAELHVLGALLWRDGYAEAAAGFVDRGHWSADDAVRVGKLIGRDNARRLYGLG